MHSAGFDFLSVVTAMRHVPYAYHPVAIIFPHHFHPTNLDVSLCVNRCLVHFLTEILPLITDRAIAWKVCHVGFHICH